MPCMDCNVRTWAKLSTETLYETKAIHFYDFYQYFELIDICANILQLLFCLNEIHKFLYLLWFMWRTETIMEQHGRKLQIFNIKTVEE